MKNTLRLLVIALLLAASAVASPRQEKKLAKMERRIETLQNNIQLKKLQVNKMVWEKYLEKVDRDRTNIAIFALKFYDPDAIFDTIPYFKAARQRFLDADERLKEVLLTYPEYREIHDKEISRGLTAAERAELKERKQFLFSELAQSDDDRYKAVRAYREESLFAENYALAQFLLSYCQSRGELMPTENVIPPHVIQNLRQANPGIRNLEDDIARMEQLLDRLKTGYIEAKYAKGA